MNNVYGTCFFISLNQERPVRQGRSFLAVCCRIINFTSYYSSVRVKYCISYGSPSSVYPKLLYRHKSCMGNSPFPASAPPQDGLTHARGFHLHIPSPAGKKWMASVLTRASPLPP